MMQERLRTLTFLSWSIGLGLTGPPLSAQVNSPLQIANNADRGARKNVALKYSNLPLSFEANRGQVDSRVKFLARGDGYTLFLTSDEAVLALKKSEISSEAAEGKVRAPGEAVLRLSLVSANSNSSVSGADELPGKVNYFIGNDPRQWRTNVPTCAKVKYESVYPGVDLVYYGTQGQLEYDFVVAPGANPDVIRLAFGAKETVGSRQSAVASRAPHSPSLAGSRFPTPNSPHFSANGDLLVGIAGGEVRLRKPVIYQPVLTDNGQRTTGRKLIDGRYRLIGHQVTFEIGSYDRSRPLVIDPVLIYSTYLGGNALDKVLGMTLTPGGNAIVVGGTTSTTFPTTPGALQTSYGGGPYDAFVTEFNPNGESLVFSTYLGGNNDDESWGVALDSSENVYISGHTASLNFPTTSNAYHSSFFGTGYDCFLAKLNSAGSTLLYSTYIAPVDPGPANEHNGDFMTASASGKAFVVGPTNYASFPVTTGAFQTKLAGQDDAFLIIIDTTKSGNSSLAYSTYLGGSSNDVAQEVAADSVGDVYVIGTTHSSNFPVTKGAYQPTCKLNTKNMCSGDIFLAKISPHGQGAADLLYSTFFGGSSTDSGVAIAIDSSGYAYLTGDTQSSDLPTTPGAFQTSCDIGKSGLCEDSYIAKFNPAGGGTSDLIYSTYFGGTGTTLSKAIAVDASGNAYVDGRTTSTDFPMQNPIQAAHAPDNGSYDGFVTELNPAGSALVFSTYLGGNNFDSFNAITLDSSGDIFFGGRTQSSTSSYPATPGAFQTAHNLNDALFNAVAGEISPSSGVGLALGPASLTFSTQLINTTSPAQSMTVLAAGSDALTVSSVVPSAGFNVTNGCSSTVAAGGTCTITVTFTPTTSGPVNGTLTLTDNAPNSPQILNVTGTGTVVQLSPASLSFGNQQVGTTSPGKKITLTNKGNTTLTVTGISITGADPGDFAETNTCTNVNPGANCSITATFTPTATGSRKADVSVSDNGGGSPQLVSLSGTGT